MKAIVAVDNQWGIGKDNHLLINIPEDMKFFREKTKNAVVIMGRKTLESFPGGKPLKNRINIVITHNSKYINDGVIIVHSVKEAAETAEKIAAKENREVFVIGGSSVYEKMLHYCESAFVTKIDGDFDADTFFPDLDKQDGWKIVNKSEPKESNGTVFCFTEYKRKQL